MCCRPFTALFVILLPVSLSFAAGNPAFNGRWDLTVKTSSETYPSWIEIKDASGTPEVRVQGKVSSVHPVKDLNVNGAKMSFETSEWFGKPTKTSWKLTVNSGRLSGVQTREDGTEGKISGVHAPALKREPPKAWTNPEPIFNGKDLTGWKPDNPETNHWKAENGDLVNVTPGANLQSTRKVQDFKLHIEYNCPQGGNSGIYLRGRYEVQVAYEPSDDEFHGMGAIYGFIAPKVRLPEKPGQWETFDITLVGRYVTVRRDGVLTVDNQEIPGITGGALDSREAEPNIIYIQGDHTGGMKYRNITLAVPAH
jgi:3-keto-disaccharide hydrolase